MNVIEFAAESGRGGCSGSIQRVRLVGRRFKELPRYWRMGERLWLNLATGSDLWPVRSVRRVSV